MRETPFERAQKHWVIGIITAMIVGITLGVTVMEQFRESTRDENARLTKTVERLEQENEMLRSRRSRPNDNQSTLSPVVADRPAAPLPATGSQVDPVDVPKTEPENAPAPEPAPNCPKNTTFQCATFLAFGARDSDTFGREARFYRFELDQPGQLTFTLNPMPNTRFVAITIYDAEYQQVDWKRFDAGQPGAFRVNLRRAGGYFAKLYPGPCCSGAPYDYAFAISR